MSVRSELVKETIVQRICERIAAQLPGDPPAAVAGALDQGLRPDGQPGSPAPAATLARAGYYARVVETELFDAARSPLPGLAADLRAHVQQGSAWADAAAELARELASREPLERSDPGHADAVSWRVPGPGGHVRHYVARRLAGNSGAAALKRDFMYGFLIRCCEEALKADSGSGRP